MKKQYTQIKDYALAGIFLFLLSPIAVAQVGIGTTNPQATLDIAGTYFPPVLTPSTLLNQNFSSYTVGQTNTPDPDCTTTPAGWVITTASPYSCAACVGQFLYIESDDNNCIQNSTVIIPFTAVPTTNSISFSMDIFYVNAYANNNDYFRVFLYNNTTSTQLLLYTNNNGTVNGNLNGPTVPVVAGNSYSIRILYYGNYAWGATVDNIAVTEDVITTPAAYAFKMDDGTAQNGYVLTTDGNGNARWMAPGTAPRPAPSNGFGISDNLLSFVSDANASVDVLNLGSKYLVSSNSPENPLDQKELKPKLNGIELQNLLEAQQKEIELLKKALREIEVIILN